MKKAVLTALCVLTLSGSAFASPLMDYSKGNASLDITYRPSLDGVCGLDTPCDLINAYNAEFDGDSWEWAGTFGIGNNFALQYRQLNSSSDIEAIVGPDFWSAPNTPTLAQEAGYPERARLPLDGLDFEKKVKAEEFNVLYKVDKNVAAFVGVVRAKEHLRLFDTIEISSDDKTIAQVGLVGSAKVADKTNAYGVVSFGKDYRNWEVGLSYEFAKDTEFNINYRDTKIDELNLFGERLLDEDIDAKDVSLKGFGFGLTVKM